LLPEEIMKRRFYVPLLTYPDAPAEAFLDSATDLAANCNALLHATVFDVSIPSIATPWPTFIDTSEMVRQAEEQSRQAGKSLAAALRSRCAETSLDCEIVSKTIVQLDVSATAVKEARLYDLTVLQSGLPFSAFAETLVFESGRPVMLYPETRCTGRFDHIAIAWDGSRASTRALADAQFLLAKAKRVTVICVPENKPDLSSAARNLTDALAARGLDVQTASVSNEGYIGDRLQFKAIELGADLLVMGGYGHSRFREFVLGGATDDVLSKTRLPVLMSH
jgi:nucleotide-binding universal stress UspA family protein